MPSLGRFLRRSSVRRRIPTSSSEWEPRRSCSTQAASVGDDTDLASAHNVTHNAGSQRSRNSPSSRDSPPQLYSAECTNTASCSSRASRKRLSYISTATGRGVHRRARPSAAATSTSSRVLVRQAIVVQGACSQDRPCPRARRREARNSRLRWAPQDLISVAIPVATRRQALACWGTCDAAEWLDTSSTGTLWRGLAGFVTDSPLPHQIGHF